MNDGYAVSNVKKPMVLLLENEPSIRRSLQMLIQANGFDVRAYALSGKLLNDPIGVEAACFITDYCLQESNGIETLTRLQQKGWSGPAILITSFPSPDVLKRAQSAGFQKVFDKPPRPHALMNTIKQLVSPTANT